MISLLALLCFDLDQRRPLDPDWDVAMRLALLLVAAGLLLSRSRRRALARWALLLKSSQQFDCRF
jgi:hypothetical protein